MRTSRLTISSKPPSVLTPKAVPTGLIGTDTVTGLLTSTRSEVDVQQRVLHGIDLVVDGHGMLLHAVRT